MAEETKNCPQCGGEIHTKAIKCKHCRAMLEKPSAPRGAPSSSTPHDEDEFSLTQVERKLGKKYEIFEELGRGGMGAVYRARQLSLDRIVAIKILPPSLSADPAFVKRFKREAKIAASLNQKNIVQVFDIEEEDGTHFFSMECVEGHGLDAILKEKGHLSVQKAIDIISQTALAVEHAHQHNVIHRDLKPQNIMVDNADNVKVMDFGLAKLTALDVTKLTETGTLLGTFDYMSPEQRRGEELDIRADIFSLGVVLFQMLTGRLPFEDPNPMASPGLIAESPPPDITSINPEVPAEFNNVVARALARDKEMRYESVSHFMNAILAIKKRETPARKDLPAKQAEKAEEAVQEQGDEQKAVDRRQKIEDLKRQLAAEPRDASLYYKLGKAYLATDESGEAIRFLMKAVALEPKKARYRLRLATAYAMHNQHARAKRQYENALLLEPANIEAHMRLGLLLEFHLRDPAAALQHYQKYTELGGKDARILNRMNLLRQEIGKAESPAAHAVAPRISPKAKLQNASQGLLKWRDSVAQTIADKEETLKKVLFSSGMFITLLLCFDAFPVTGFFLLIIASLAIAFQTAIDPKFGIATGLILMFFSFAFYSPILAYLFAAGVFLLFLFYRGNKPGSILVVLLIPLLLKLNLAYVVPLGAAIFLKTRPGWRLGTRSARFARRLGFVACIAGLGCMVATNTHQMGPLSVNHEGIPVSITPYDKVDIGAFFSFGWIKSLFTPALILPLMKFVKSIFPALIKPPIALIEMVSWGFAGYTVGRLYQKRTGLYLAYALGGGSVVLLLQAVLIKNLLGDEHFSFTAVVTSLILSGLILSVLVFFKIGVREEEPAEDEILVSTPTTEDLEDVSWDAIGGLQDVKKEIQMATQYQFQRGFSRFGRRFDVAPPKGILFYGPPGCGKTMFAKVMAKDVGAAFFSVKGSDFRSKWYGETEQNLSNIFASAREKAPAILFFDEMDSMLERREEPTMGDSPESKVVALFLTEMDGVKPLRGVLIVGATNAPDSIDPAILRPGRFDKLIYIPLPDQKGREKIFRVHLTRKPLGANIDYKKLATITERFSGADIADVCSKIAEQAMQESLREGRTMLISMNMIIAQIKATKPSVSLEMLRRYEELQEKYGRRVLKAEAEPAEKKEKHTWEEIGGLEDLKRELLEAVESPLKKPELYEKYKIKPPRGVLFYGPPGCGKTLMAKVVAGQCGAHFLSVDIKKESGESIRKWFVRARENKPSILFFDEIDSIAGSRDLAIMGDQGVVTQLLIEMDGMEELKQVVVIAATNRPDRLDSALMRPGRFDRLVYIPPPDEESRRKILEVHLQGKPLAADVDLSELARRTEDYSGADLAALCYEASMILIRGAGKEHKSICGADFMSAMEKVKPSITPEDRLYFDEMKERFSRGV